MMDQSSAEVLKSLVICLTSWPKFNTSYPVALGFCREKAENNVILQYTKKSKKLDFFFKFLSTYCFSYSTHQRWPLGQFRFQTLRVRSVGFTTGCNFCFFTISVLEQTFGSPGLRLSEDCAIFQGHSKCVLTKRLCVMFGCYTNCLKNGKCKRREY